MIGGGGGQSNILPHWKARKELHDSGNGPSRDVDCSHNVTTTAPLHLPAAAQAQLGQWNGQSSTHQTQSAWKLLLPPHLQHTGPV